MGHVLCELLRSEGCDGDGDKGLGVSSAVQLVVDSAPWEELETYLESIRYGKDDSAGGLSPLLWDTLLMNASEKCGADQIDRILQLCINHTALNPLAVCILRNGGGLDYRVVKRVVAIIDPCIKTDQPSILKLPALACLLSLLTTQPEAIPVQRRVNLTEQLFQLVDDPDDDVHHSSIEAIALLPQTSEDWTTLSDQARRELNLILTELQNQATNDILRAATLTTRFRAVCLLISTLLENHYPFPCALPISTYISTLSHAIQSDTVHIHDPALQLLSTFLNSFPTPCFIPLYATLLDAVASIVERTQTKTKSTISVHLFQTVESIIVTFGLPAMQTLIGSLRRIAVETIEGCIKSGGTAGAAVDYPTGHGKKKRKRATEGT